MRARIAMWAMGIATFAAGSAEGEWVADAGQGSVRQVAVETKFVRLRGEVTVEAMPEGAMIAKDAKGEPLAFVDGKLRLRDGETWYDLALEHESDSWVVSVPDPGKIAIEYTPEKETVFRNPNAASRAISMWDGPTVAILSGEEAAYEIQEAPVSYFARDGDAWELKESRDARCEMSFVARAKEDGTVEFEKLALTIVSMAGREPIAGANVDAGPPIFETRMIETTLSATSGTTYWLWPKIDDRRGALLIGVRATVEDVDK